MFNATGGVITFKPQSSSKVPAASTFASNFALGGHGGNGGQGGVAIGGAGGSGNAVGFGGHGGSAKSGTGGNGGSANQGAGGGLNNPSAASFDGVTVNFTANQAQSGNGGNGTAGGNGGSVSGGNGGNGGFESTGLGAGIVNESTGNLTINPRLGARKGSNTGQVDRRHHC